MTDWGEIEYTAVRELRGPLAVVTGVRGVGWDEFVRITLESGEQRTLIEGASFARYLPSGEILYVKAESLFVASFDVERLAASVLLLRCQKTWRSAETARLSLQLRRTAR